MSGGVFNTQRPRSVQERVQELAARRGNRAANLRALTEAKAAEKRASEMNSVLENVDTAVDKEAQKNTALDKLKEETATKQRKQGLASLESRLFTEGKKMLWSKVLFETAYDACWIDTPLKERLMQPLYETFESTVDFMQTVCPKAFPSSPNTRLLEAMDSIITETAKKASKRIAKECDDDPNCDPNRINFDLNDDEEQKFNQDIQDLGKDDIADKVKDKVLSVIQDEKAAGKKKAEAMKEIDDAKKDDSDDTDDEDDSEDDNDSKKKDSDKSDDGDDGSDDVTEGLSLRMSPPPDEFYKVASKVFADVYKKSSGRDAQDVSVNVTKAQKADVKDYRDMKGTEKKSFSRMINVYLDDVVKVLKSNGFKQGSTKMPTAYLFFLKKLKTGYVEAQITDGGKLTKGIKQCQVLLRYKKKASRKMQKQYAIESTGDVIGKTPMQIQLEQLTLEKMERDLRRSHAGSVFEALVMFDRVGVEQDALMEGVSVDLDKTMNAAMLEAIMQYTVIETLNTMGVCNLTSVDTSSIRKALMEDMNVMSADKNNSSKKTRINTMKYKRNRDDKVVAQNSAK